MELNCNVLIGAMKLAPKMEFVETDDELQQLIGALYAAMMWGRKVDRENKLIQERNKSLK